MPVGVEAVKPDEVWKVSGSDGQAVAVRLHEPGISLAHVAAQHEALLAAAHHRVPVPDVLHASLTGQSTFEVDGRWADVTTWITHDAFGRDRRAHMVRASSVLAALHDALGDITVRPPAAAAAWRTSGELADLLDAHEQELLDGVTAAQRSQVGDAIDHSRVALDLIGDRLSPERTGFSLTQGDFGGQNVLMRRGEVVGIVDFGRLDLRPRLFDLAWVVLFDVLHEEFAAHHGRFIADCVSAYRSGAAAPDSLDWQSLPLLVGAIAVQGIAEAAFEAQPAAEVMAFGQIFPLALDWIREPPWFLMAAKA